MDAAAAGHLFAKTLLDPEEDGPGWAAVQQLRQNGDRYIFDFAVHWTESTEPLKRERAAQVLCQLRDARSQVSLFQKESCAVLLRMLPGETDEHVLDAVICGFGHLGDPNAIPAIGSFSGHASAEVRFAIAFALGSFAEDQQSISTLLQLVIDDDADVDFGTLIWSGSAFCFGPPSKRTDTLMRAAARGGGTRWIGERRWSCSRRSAESTSSA